jgi:hypothetical protein
MKTCFYGSCCLIAFLALAGCLEPGGADSAVRIYAEEDDYTNGDIDLTQGDSLSFKAQLAFGTGDITWTRVDEEGVLTVTPLTLKGETLTVTAGNEAAGNSAALYARLENSALPEEALVSFVKVHVVDAVPIGSVHIAADGQIVTGKTLTLKIGEQVQLTPVVKPVTAKWAPTWEGGGGNAAASVTSGGLVSAHTEGSTDITLKVKNTNASASTDEQTVSCTVRVLKDEPITGLVILRGNEEVFDLSLDIGEGVTLTAALSPAGVNATVTWTSDAPGTVSVSGGKITALASGGPVLIRASAVNTVTTMPVTASVTVNVKNPNLYWEWIAADGVSGTIDTGAGATLPGHDKDGALWAVAVRQRPGGNITVGTNGITIDATEAGGGISGMLVIGETKPEEAMDSNATSCPEGVFDLSAAGGMKVTLNIEVLSAAGTNRSFVVFLNNSTATAANTPLTNTNNEGRIIYVQTPATSNSGEQSKSFTPATFKQDYIDTLSKAFLGIVQLGNSSGNYGAKVLIKAIRIEYQ